MDLILPQVAVLVSRLIAAGSGAGKSESIITELTALARSGLCTIVLMDSHGSTARKFMLNLVDQGLAGRVLYDLFASFTRVLAGTSVSQSNHPNPFKRRAINQARVMALMNIIWRATQRVDDVFAMPMMSKYLKWGIMLLLFQKEPEPLAKLPLAYYPNHPEFRRLVENCTHQLTRLEGLHLLQLHRTNNFNLLESKIGPAQRAVEASFDFDAFRERADGDFSIGDALRQKKIIILDGSDDESVPKELATAIYGCWNYQIFSFLQQNFAQSREPLPVVVVWEEAAATKLVGKYELQMLREGRKLGFFAWVVTQELGSFDLPTKTAIKANCPEHVWGNPGDAAVAVEAAEDIAIRQLDPFMVHHVDETERMLQDGWEYELRETIAESKHDGEKHTTISRTEVPKARYRSVTDSKTAYVGLKDQILLKAADLLEMGPGFRMITNRVTGYVSKEPEYIPMLPDPFPEDDYPGLADAMLARAIEQSQARPEFKTPVQHSESWDATITPSAKPETTQPSQRLPEPRRRRGKR